MADFTALLTGYQRFRREGWSRERDRWADLSEGQNPQVMVIACSDSRVDPAQIFDTSPGEIFVVRNIAALVPPFETNPGLHGVSAALEFAVQVLEVKEIVVMGHGMCGGCKAALTQSLHGAPPGEGGFIAITVVVDTTTGRAVSRPEISGRGFSDDPKALAAVLPNAKTVVLPGAGHMMMIEDPPAFAAAVQACCRETGDRLLA